MEALEMLNDLVDESDPDTDVPNIVHAFQTAERIRKVYPDLEWMQITGLVHDLGKVSLSTKIKTLYTTNKIYDIYKYCILFGCAR